jgi:hypothetical protein
MHQRYLATMSRTAIIVLAALCHSSAKAQEVNHLIRMAHPATRLHIGGYWHINSNCEPIAPLPTAMLEKSPEHGRVCFRREDVNAKHYLSSARSALCTGRQVPGISVEYQARDGYNGNDVVQYSILFGKGHQETDSVDLIVVPGNSDASQPNAAADEAPQAPGPMPECPEAVS